MAKITILGCGYGTALGVLFTTFGHEVVTWTKFEQEAELLRTEREHKPRRKTAGIPRRHHRPEMRQRRRYRACGYPLAVLPGSHSDREALCG